jgi:hypothetical protein
MHPLAHHTGEEALFPLLLLAGGGLPLLLAITRTHLATARAWLTRAQRSREAPRR